MKSFAFALLLVVAGAFAFPQVDVDSMNHNVVEQQIINIINQISEGIKKIGLDPVNVESAEFEHIATPGAIEMRASLEDLTMKGGSNIQINKMQYIPGVNRLIFDISLPELLLTLGSSKLEVVFFEYDLDAELKGSLSIGGMRLAGEVNLTINIIEGISIRTMTLDFFGGLVWSELSLVANDRDFSEPMNDMLAKRIPGFMDDNRNEINRYLETIMHAIFDRIL